MAMTQRFVLKRPQPALPGEWVCAGCDAPMVQREDDSAVEMTHADTCREVGDPGASQR